MAACFRVEKFQASWLLIAVALLFIASMPAMALDARTSACERVSPAEGLPAPSSMPLQDYETKALYPWLFRRAYAGLPAWAVDGKVRDTGPYIDGKYYGTHPAVRIHYSPEVVAWLEDGRPANQPLPDGAIIVKEMFPPPAAIYDTIRNNEWFTAHPEQYDALLAKMGSLGWTVMIKDRCGDSKDGWFWAGPGILGSKGNIDDYSHVLTSGFGLGTCIRCHASAESENTFASRRNYAQGETPIEFHSDNSWRSEGALKSILATLSTFPQLPAAELEKLRHTLVLPASQRPWDPASDAEKSRSHTPDHDPLITNTKKVEAAPQPNTDFVAAFSGLNQLSAAPSDSERQQFTFPEWFADHVYPGPKPKEYMTASNCYGCHGGLGGAPSGVSQFVVTGPGYGEGYNLSPFGEWRWSPMGLAGRDPIFHAQIESEMIILLKENGLLANGRPATCTQSESTSCEVHKSQQALLDTCLRCHGAMGLRQKGLDAPSHSVLNPGFNIDLFYLTAPLTAARKRNPDWRPPANQPFPPQKLDYGEWTYGGLAREGVSCAICHNIAPPKSIVADAWAAQHRDQAGAWLGPKKESVWTDSFFYFLGLNNTGLYERAPNDELFGPFSDVKQKPMQHAMGITPVPAAKMEGDTEPFTRNSAMCGTCHTINLPNIGQTRDENPILTALEPNPRFRSIPHSIEQATYLEWLNSKFGPGKDNQPGPAFQSCQDCHMPNRFASADKRLPEIRPLAAQIATIQDASFPEADHALPPAELDVQVRTDYRRHELVGLNGFMIEMFRQFSDILGADLTDYETGAVDGAEFAIENMLLAAREGRVAEVEVTRAKRIGSDLEVDVRIANKTGHRFPSGVAFRRVWVELLVLDKPGRVLWGSGQTNSAGLIVDNRGKPLPTELLAGGTIKVDGKATDHQPNYQKIVRDDQVQIYEELTKNAGGAFTTSFVHRVEHVKDNRLLPEGWVPGREFAGQTPMAGIGDQGDLLKEFMIATDPDGVDGDPDFASNPSSGADNVTYVIPIKSLRRGSAATVRATVYSQAFMPAWFYERFSLANEAKAQGYSTIATDRLFYIASRLNLEGTAMEDWKIEVDSAQSPVTPK